VIDLKIRSLFLSEGTGGGSRGDRRGVSDLPEFRSATIRRRSSAAVTTLPSTSRRSSTRSFDREKPPELLFGTGGVTWPKIARSSVYGPVRARAANTATN